MDRYGWRQYLCGRTKSIYQRKPRISSSFTCRGPFRPSIAAVVCNLDKKNQPKAKSSNVAAGYKLLGRFVSCRLQCSHPVIIVFLISVNRLCDHDVVSSMYQTCFFFLSNSFTAPFLVEQHHDQPILSFPCIIQCTVQWVSGRIKSEQTTAWNKCWCTVPNIARSVLFISLFSPKWSNKMYRVYLRWYST